ncbi:type IV pilus twitching motility protein PilT [Patescibacteria group bacterium]
MAQDQKPEDKTSNLNIPQETASAAQDFSQTTTEKTLEATIVKGDIIKYIDVAVTRNASDLHLVAGVKPTIRIDGKLIPIDSEKPLSPMDIVNVLKAFVPAEQLKRLQEKRELDFSFGYKDKMRFRVNLFYQRGNISAALRLIPYKIKSISELKLPPIIEKFAMASQGFVIVTGPTGHGKSSTLAALVDHINKHRNAHVVTIEDPIEYVFSNNKSIIQQREVYSDTLSFSRALRSVLREDPNVVLVGEMRDLETIETALTVAETGHLVLTTLHTNNAAQTADRIIDVFPPHKQGQVRAQLANVLLGVVSQRLIPRIDGGRAVASELMIADSAVRNVIREGKTYQLPNIIATSVSEGMINLDKVLADLVSRGEISIDDALVWANDPKSLKMNIY